MSSYRGDRDDRALIAGYRLPCGLVGDGGRSGCGGCGCDEEEGEDGETEEHFVFRVGGVGDEWREEWWIQVESGGWRMWWPLWWKDLGWKVMQWECEWFVGGIVQGGGEDEEWVAEREKRMVRLGDRARNYCMGLVGAWLV